MYVKRTADSNSFKKPRQGKQRLTFETYLELKQNVLELYTCYPRAMTSLIERLEIGGKRFQSGGTACMHCLEADAGGELQAELNMNVSSFLTLIGG